MWMLRPFLKPKDSNKNKDPVDGIPNSNRSNFRRPNTVFIIITSIIVLAVVVWLLPKLGINFLALLQKIIPTILSLRGILPF